MATYIVIRTMDGVSIVRSVHPTAAEATAAAAKDPDLAAVGAVVSDDVEPGWHFTAPDRVSPTGAPDVAANRREILRGAWLAAERAYSPLWENATVYGRRIEMNCRAAAVASNLTSARYQTLLSEAQWPGALWQVRHNVSQWAGVFPDDRDTWVYHWTGEAGAPNDSSLMELNKDAGFNWISWLRETD